MAQPKSELREYLEAGVIAVALAFLIITFVAQSYVVQGASMEPSLHNGERLLVDKLTYRFRDPQRGEIIVFRYPADPGRKFIKRIIGLPGDRIEIHDQTVFLNGEPLTEPYINGPTYGEFSAVVVPPNHYFVLGDNRNNSEDSRYPDVGAVPQRSIVGRSLAIYWPLSDMSVVRIPPGLR